MNAQSSPLYFVRAGQVGDKQVISNGVGVYWSGSTGSYFASSGGRTVFTASVFIRSVSGRY